MWWLWTTITLLIAVGGFAGTFLPALPGASLIFAASVFHYFMAGAEYSVGVGTIIGLGLLAFLSIAFDFLSGAAGAKWFGAGRWGMLGGLLGALIGIFFGIPGLIIGPLVGALLFEWVAGKKLPDATKAGVGSFLGTVVGLGGKLVIAGLMLLWLVLAIFL